MVLVVIIVRGNATSSTEETIRAMGVMSAKEEDGYVIGRNGNGEVVARFPSKEVRQFHVEAD